MANLNFIKILKQKLLIIFSQVEKLFICDTIQIIELVLKKDATGREENLKISVIFYPIHQYKIIFTFNKIDVNT